jgi:hypothetical protein
MWLSRIFPRNIKTPWAELYIRVYRQVQSSQVRLEVKGGSNSFAAKIGLAIASQCGKKVKLRAAHFGLVQNGISVYIFHSESILFNCD